MTDYPRITIVTPSFNQALYLEQTIQSVLSQGYPNLEYLVVDGGSTDGSVEIIHKYQDQISWWVSERDNGQAEGINKGLQRATGEIVAWLNSDDLYVKGALDAAMAAFSQHPEAGLVFGDVLSVDGSGRSLNLMQYGNWGLTDLMQFKIIGQPGVFMRRSVLEKVGLLDGNYHFLLDHQLWLRMALQAPMVYLPQPLAVARFHAQAKNVAQAAQFGSEAYAIVEWMQRQPQLSEKLKNLSRRVWAGAHRIDARYLLDGGQPGAALKAYLRSVGAFAPIGLAEWHRMIYALLCLAGLEKLKPLYYRLRRIIRGKNQPELGDLNR